MTDISSKKLHYGASASLISLIILCLCWETFISPFKPGNYFFAIKTVPLMLAFVGVLKARIYTMQWASMLVLLYFMEGIVRATGDTEMISRLMAGLEIFLSLVFYASAIFYVRPFKRLAKAKQKMEAEQMRAVTSPEGSAQPELKNTD